MESVEWQSAHYDEPYATQRKDKLPRKLGLVGLKCEDKTARILDACCGRGDALETLHGWGFTNLTGLDLTPHPGWNSRPFVIRQGNVMEMPFDDASFDCITNFHALHHFGNGEGVERFLRECRRVLKPGGRLYIVDFPASTQIWTLFWLFRAGLYPPTGGLRNFAKIVKEEWSYLKPYLQDWRKVDAALRSGLLRVESFEQRLFLYYIKMVKL